MDFLIALSPILVLILLLNGLSLPSHIAALAALGVSLLAANFFFAFPLSHGLLAVAEGAALALWPILLVIVAALFLYRLTLFTGGMETIKALLTSVSRDRRAIVLLVGWGFGAFLEGMAGFGTAVAIPAGMLIAMGFPPLRSALSCLIANGVPTCFGSVALPLATLASLTGVPLEAIGRGCALQLFPLNLVTPFLALWAMFGTKALRGAFLPALLAGLSLSAAELFFSFTVGPGLSVITGSLLTMGTTALAARFLSKEEIYLMLETARQISKKEIFSATLPFLLAFIFLLATSSACPPVHAVLSQMKTAVSIVPGAAPFVFAWSAAGVYIFAAAVISGFYERCSVRDMAGVLWETVWNLRWTAATLLSVIATAKVMGYAGMTETIAEILAETAGACYPPVAPYIGALGSFITGSATSSGVLFGSIQTGAAAAIGADPGWLTAANETGASLGKLVSPQNIAIAAGATGLVGKEGELLKKALPAFLLLSVMLAVVVWLGS